VAATVWVSCGGERLNLAVALYPLAVWAAVTLGPRVLAAQQLVVAGGIAVLASDQATAFQVRAVDLPLDLGDQITQIYLLTLVVSGLPLALAMRQRFEAVEVIAARERSVQANFLSSAVPTALLTYDGDRLVFDEVNEPALAMLRRRSSDLAGVDVDEVLSGPAPVAEAARDLADGRQPSWSDTRELGTDPVRHLDVNIALIGKSEGLHRLSMTLHDITEEREMQRRLDQEQEYSRAITDSSPSPILVLDQHGTVLLTNPAALEVSGYTEAELVGRPIWAALVPPEQRHVVERHFASGRRMLLQGESTVVTATGDRRQLIFASRPLDTDAGSQGRQVITASDVTEERKQAQLMSHLLASATTVAFIGTDVDGRITLFNEGAAQMLGLDSREAIGRDFLDFLHQDDLLRRARVTRRPPGFAAVVGPVADGAAPETRDWTWVPRTGSLLQVSMTVSRMTDDLGLTLGYFFVARDVSDTRRSQEILVKALDRERQAVAKLQALDSVRDEFVSTVSHELRTPMTSIIGSAEMLADGLVGPLSDEQRPLVDVIARNGERLLQLANDLLALVQNDVPGWAESVVEVDLRDIVVESHESVASLRSSRALEVVNSLGEAPVPVFGDVQKLERALTNLLSNAIKFTPDGGQVTTSVSADQERGIARLVVSDTGLGIAEQDIPRVFERFFRSTRVQELAIQGTGLGLPIVKDIVESHRGTIAVASRPGQGTSFTIELPLAEALQCRVSAGQQRD
jgi:PAS domain S-box-containing protein